MTQLSEHFTLAEMCGTSTGIQNQPGSAMETRLSATAQQMEKVRALLGGKPISISSGYRSAKVNAAVGGSATSAHVAGFACDFTCAGFGDPHAIVQRLRQYVQFDQLIYEHPPGHTPWVHISFDPRSRGQVLECADPGKYVSLPA